MQSAATEDNAADSIGAATPVTLPSDANLAASTGHATHRGYKAAPISDLLQWVTRACSKDRVRRALKGSLRDERQKACNESPESGTTGNIGHAHSELEPLTQSTILQALTPSETEDTPKETPVDELRDITVVSPLIASPESSAGLSPRFTRQAPQRHPGCSCISCDPITAPLVQALFNRLGTPPASVLRRSGGEMAAASAVVSTVFLDWDDALVPTSYITRVGPLKNSAYRNRLRRLLAETFAQSLDAINAAPRTGPNWYDRWLSIRPREPRPHPYEVAEVWVVTNGGQENVAAACVDAYNWAAPPVGSYPQNTMEVFGTFRSNVLPSKPTYSGSVVRVRSTMTDNHNEPPKLPAHRVKWKARSLKAILAGQMQQALLNHVTNPGAPPLFTNPLLFNVTIIGDEAEPQILRSVMRHLTQDVCAVKTVKTQTFVTMSDNQLKAHRDTVTKQLSILTKKPSRADEDTVLRRMVMETERPLDLVWRFDRFRPVKLPVPTDVVAEGDVTALTAVPNYSKGMYGL